MASQPPACPTGCPPLTVIALESLAAHIQSVPTLQRQADGAVLPEELCCSLFELVLNKGKLTPRVLDMFEQTEHERLAQLVAALGIRKWTPPLQPTTRGGWLGQKPSWY